MSGDKFVSKLVFNWDDEHTPITTKSLFPPTSGKMFTPFLQQLNNCNKRGRSQENAVQRSRNPRRLVCVSSSCEGKARPS